MNNATALVPCPEPKPQAPEYFLLLSYSSLLTVVHRLEQIRLGGGRATLFCFAGPLAKFLYPLQQEGWVQVVPIDPALVRPPSLVSPVSVLAARRNVTELYRRYFQKIPGNCLVHFYNRHYSTLAGSILARLRERCRVVYVECDPVGIPRGAFGPRAIAYWLVHTAIYRIPIRMVGRQRPFEELSARFMEATVDYSGRRISDPEQLQGEYVYRMLRRSRSTRVLWLVGNHLTRGLVDRDGYLRMMRAVAHEVGHRHPAASQTVKFHPYAEEFEDVWSSETYVLPAYVPSQFVSLRGVEFVLTLSTTSSFPIEQENGSPRVVSLLKLIPFISEEVRDRFCAELGRNIDRSFYLPTSVEELACVLDEGSDGSSRY